ncbi:MAG TPA: hypothetical protein VNW71_07780 [Thermoanaerobaculia bacterium]|nr:hypothetical protein [Thermoanaerobaculia bacterium]
MQSDSSEGSAVIRTVLLTIFLIALGVGLTLPQAAARLGDVETYRLAVLWGIPAAALILSLILHPRLTKPANDLPGPIARRFALLAVAVLAFGADQSFLGISYWTGWATFTSGAQEVSEGEMLVTALWALPLCLILGIWGWERALRGSVYTGWRRRLERPGAIAASAAVGLALSLPSILPGGEVRDPAFAGASLVAVLCREISFALLFSRGGGLLVAGLYRGALYFAEAFVVHDWNSLFFPSFNYVTSGAAFYAVRAASALLALGVVAVMTRRRPERLPESEPPIEEAP